MLTESMNALLDTAPRVDKGLAGASSPIISAFRNHFDITNGV